jgi:hypothetical protein
MEQAKLATRQYAKRQAVPAEWATGLDGQISKLGAVLAQRTLMKLLLLATPLVPFRSRAHRYAQLSQ